MTVNLDVLMYLARIALCVAGVIAIIYLVLLFKSVIDTMSELQETLKAVNRDLVKLESPLDTIGQVSNTVDEVQAYAKKAAIGAINVFSKGTEKLNGMLSKKSDTPAEAADKVQSDEETLKADFRKIDNDLFVIEKDQNQMVQADMKPESPKA